MHPRENVATAIGRLWWLPLIRGLLLLLLGGYAMINPQLTIGVLATVIGIFVIIDGVFVVLAGVVEKVPSRAWIITRGVIGILIGLFVVANPLLVSGITATLLLYLLAFSAILIGSLEIVGAIQDRRQLEGAGWFVLVGALTVLFGLCVLMAPISFGLFMVRVLGVFAILAGVSLLGFAFRLREVGKRLQA